MKDDWAVELVEAFRRFVKVQTGFASLVVLFALAAISALANRWLYESFPGMSLALKVPINLVLLIGWLGGLLAPTIMSFRFNRTRHPLFGVIGLVVVFTFARFVMGQLRQSGIEPANGPPLYGGLVISFAFGWIFGFILSLIDRTER